MKHAARWSAVLVLCVAGAARAELRGDIETILKDKALAKATVGIEIERLGHGPGDSSELYEHNSRTPLVPASNLKLATTSAALDRLGADFKFRTILLLHDNNLVLIGDGDPNLGDAEYLKRVGWKSVTVFQNWAAQLKKLNITSIQDVIVDDSIFDQEFLHPHWPVRQIDHWYVAEVAGADFNVNCVDFAISASAPGTRIEYRLDPDTHYLSIENSCVAGRNDIQFGRKPGTNQVLLRGQAPEGHTTVWSETVHDPSLYTATVLAETVRDAGIEVKGTVRRDRTLRPHRSKSPGWTIVGVHETPLAVSLSRANKDSINLCAECLCKRLGHEATSDSGSWENGTAAVGAFLHKAGVADTEFHLDDGSGLSRHNSISPHALARVLMYDCFGPNRESFVNSLAISGQDGTMLTRFRGTDLRGRVLGKSGFVDGVSCLSGLLKARDGQWYAFSIMMNGVPSAPAAKVLQEKIVRAVDAHSAPLSARR